MKSKIVFLTGEDLLDVDKPIVAELSAKYKIIWIVVLKGYGWFSEQEIVQFCTKHNIDVHVLMHKHKIKSPKTFLLHLRLLRIIENIKPDLVYDSYLGTPWMHFVSWFFIPRTKFVIAIHDVVQHHEMNFRFVREKYSNFLMRKFENIHLFSESQYQIFEKRYSANNILIAPLCLKDFGNKSVKRFKIKNSRECVFLFFGIIRANKGVDLIIDATNKLAAKYKDFKVIIAGKSDADYWDIYKKKITASEKFELIIRTIDNHEISNLFARSHFVLLPYRDVTQSGVLLTSYNYGVPAIASDLNGFNEYINKDETGFLFQSENPDDLYNSMEKALLLSSVDYQRMNDGLADFVEREISDRAIADKYMVYFDKLLKVSE